MKNLALALPLVALAALAGCSTTEEYRVATPVTSSTGTPVTTGSGAPAVSYGGAVAPIARAGTVSPVSIRPGTGTVEAITAVPVIGSASVGATAPAAASRLAIRMTDGTVQYLDYTDRDLTVGSRVEVTSDGFIRKL